MNNTLGEFTQILGDIDSKVSRQASVICVTNSNFEKFTGLGNPVIYVIKKSLVWDLYPYIKTNVPAPDYSFFLIQERQFLEYVTEIAARHREGVTGPLLYEMTLNRVLLKNLTLQSNRNGGIKNFIDRRLIISPDNIASIFGLTLSLVRDSLEVEILKQKNATAMFKDIDPEKLKYYAILDGTILYLVSLIRKVQQKRGSEEAIAILKKIVAVGNQPH